MNSYAQKYIDECRLKVNAQLSAYRNLITAARKQAVANEKQLNSAIESFEPIFFNNIVLTLDHYFCHRSRTMEGKDGNPLNEVRVMCNSIMHNNNIMTADNVSAMSAFAGLNTIKLDSAKSALKYRIGDEIKLNEADFLLIFRAFFAEIENKYLETGKKSSLKQKK